uniref:Acetyl-coenzyme A carboxylase carboxyl transferase subunit beta, chloroplastic n=1 Tax=Dolichandra cynanchoides TaxID=353977 RepID=A0A2P1G9X0_9LAMI|nr:acetyl-CoA carboxylase carboxyltransferase beta subunit [Dolichandra cynanchoides]AVM81746.1 acetyl-CoA carboxylase carboxyltransferase beta subunit [Dolichandra cynanchoides]
MLVKVLNSKCCFGLNCCFSLNWSFNPIFFKTQSSWGNGKKGLCKACGESGEPRFINGNGAPLDAKGGTCGKGGDPDPIFIFIVGNGDPLDAKDVTCGKSDKGNANGNAKGNAKGNANGNAKGNANGNDNGNGAPLDEKGGTCGKSDKDESGNDNGNGNGAPLDEKDGTCGKSDKGNANGNDNGNGNGAPLDEKGGTCGKSDKDESGTPNPAKGNDPTLREDSKNPKPKDPESNDSDGTGITIPTDDSDPKHSPGGTPPHIADLWVLCEDCHQLNYRKLLKGQKNMCERCEYHFKMNSPERIEFLIDPGTWNPIDEDMASPDPDPSESDSKEKTPPVYESLQKEISLLKSAILKKISERSCESDSKEKTPPVYESLQKEILLLKSAILKKISERSCESDSEEKDTFESDSEEKDTFESNSEKGKPYADHLDSYRKKTGLNEAVQTGVGKINGIPASFGIMEFEFMGGSMGSVVGEKIARLVEYSINQSLPLIIVCASGGARMQEGSVSLMQMGKISCTLLDYDLSNSKLVYISILASPTTGGVTASFGTLADIILGEPNSYIAFAGKRVIEETLKQPIPEGSQEAEPLFEKGILDQIIPRKLLKHIMTEFLKFHGFNPLNSNSIK